MPEPKFRINLNEKKKPELNPAQRRERLKDPNFLPPDRDYIVKAFSERRGGPYSGFVVNIADFCDKNTLFEIYNEAYINVLADYIVSRIEELKIPEDRPLLILEVGAGDGRLTHFLQKRLDEVAPGRVKLVATDYPDDNLYEIEHHFPSEEIDYQEAVDKYNPDIVISSWMPYKVDFSAKFRENDNVQEYILIGEDCNGCCGSEDTWDYDRIEEEGFEMVRPEKLKGINDLQFCCTDYLGFSSSPTFRDHSRTISFRRRKE